MPNRLPKKQTGAGYAAAIEELRTKAREWVGLYPQANPKIQYNFPPAVGVIGTVLDALRSGFMSANEQGNELLKWMGALDDRADAPTITMVRLALEFLDAVK